MSWARGKVTARKLRTRSWPKGVVTAVADSRQIAHPGRRQAGSGAKRHTTGGGKRPASRVPPSSGDDVWRPMHESAVAWTDSMRPLTASAKSYPQSERTTSCPSSRLFRWLSLTSLHSRTSWSAPRGDDSGRRREVEPKTVLPGLYDLHRLPNTPIPTGYYSKPSQDWQLSTLLDQPSFLRQDEHNINKSEKEFFSEKQLTYPTLQKIQLSRTRGSRKFTLTFQIYFCLHFENNDRNFTNPTLESLFLNFIFKKLSEFHSMYYKL